MCNMYRKEQLTTSLTVEFLKSDFCSIMFSNVYTKNKFIT